MHARKLLGEQLEVCLVQQRNPLNLFILPVIHSGKKGSTGHAAAPAGYLRTQDATSKSVWQESSV